METTISYLFAHTVRGSLVESQAKTHLVEAASIALARRTLLGRKAIDGVVWDSADKPSCSVPRTAGPVPEGQRQRLKCYCEGHDFNARVLLSEI